MLHEGRISILQSQACEIITDIFEYCSKELPKWNTISISGYHIREAGANAVQELAFTLADGKAYLQAAIDKGLDINVFAKRLSFFFNAHNNLFEEVAKFRAARKMWAQITKELECNRSTCDDVAFSYANRWFDINCAAAAK